MKPATACPLFVVGTARSGTTWLANLLISHPDISGVAAVEHQGIHESHFYSHSRYCFPQRLGADQFFSAYSCEDYFVLTELALEEMVALDGSRTVPEWFRAMMERYAQGKRYWLEKTPKHAAYYRELIQDFPDARFIMIRRGFRATLMSNLKRYGQVRLPMLLQVAAKVFRYVTDLRAMDALERAAPSACISTEYEDLVADPARETSRIVRWLDLPEADLKSQFAPDSSFGSKEKPGLPTMAWAAARAFRLLFLVLPLSGLLWLRKSSDRAQARGLPKYSLLSARSRGS